MGNSPDYIDPADPPDIITAQPTAAEFAALTADNVRLQAKLTAYEGEAQPVNWQPIKRAAAMSGTPTETLRRRCERGIVQAYKDANGRWFVNVTHAALMRFQLARLSDG